MSSVRKSIAFAALDSYLGLILQIASTVVIARILTPEQTGVFAVAAVFASLASTFRDFGVAEYLIQEKELDNNSIRAALTVNLAISWLMGLVLFGLAPVAASFYRETGVGGVMKVQAVNFLLIPFGAVTMAWFRREMNFRPIFVANQLANITSFSVAVVLALNGQGYMSLAWASLAGTTATVAVSVLMRPAGFPSMPGIRGIGKVLHFGKFASGIYIFGQIGKGAPEMIIGRAQGMAPVGMFSRGSGLVEIFNRLVLRAVMPVCLPYFARSVREEGTPRRGLLHAMSLLTGVGWPFLLCTALAAFAAIRLMYGPQWISAVPLAQVLCAVAAVELIYFPAKEALLSLGKAKESNQLQLVIQGLRVLGVLAVVPFGLIGACWGLLAAALGGAYYSHICLHRLSGVLWEDVRRALAKSVIVSTITGAPLIAFLAMSRLDESNYIGAGAAGASASAIAWLFALHWTQHPLWPEVRPLLIRVAGHLPGR